MDKKELRGLVKSYFNLTDKEDIKHSEEITKETFASGELIDGTKVNNGSDKELEVGDSLFVETEAGDTVDAPSGEHELKDGTVVVVDGEGKITGLDKPNETGQGSLSKEEEASKETEVELADDAINIADELPLAEHGDEESMDEHGDERAEIIEAILEEIGPKIVELQKKLEEHEVTMAEHADKMQEHYSAAEETSVTEKAFSKAGYGSKPEGDILSFNNGNLRSMQYENVLSRASKNNKK